MRFYLRNGSKNIPLNNTTDLATGDIIMHHLEAFQDNDLDAVMSDYTKESVLITQTATYAGPDEIRGFFTALMIHFPKPGSDFQLDKLVADDGLAYIVWHAHTPSLDVALGTDTFMLKEGKIFRQTFAGQMEFTEQ
jgi:ketosteroid isomerase-like protein